MSRFDYHQILHDSQTMVTIVSYDGSLTTIRYYTTLKQASNILKLKEV